MVIIVIWSGLSKAWTGFRRGGGGIAYFILYTFLRLLHPLSHFINPKVHYRIHNSPPRVPILSQIKPVHDMSKNYLRSLLIVSSQCFPIGLFSFRFPNQNAADSPLPCECHRHRPSHSTSPDRPNI
jgi:hypothetical protein